MSDYNYFDIITENFNDSVIKIVDLNIRGDKKNKILEVFIDSEKGVSIDDITSVNSVISDIIDNYQQKNGLNEISKLIVSSPGVDNNFKFAWQIKKHTGRELIGILNDGTEISGKILDVNNSGDISLERIKNKNKKETEIINVNFSDLKESKIKLKF